MHEVFLDGVIAQDDLEKTAKVLQGYCNMAPVCFLRRRLFWEGPKVRNPKGLNLQHENVKQATPAKKSSWRTLNEQLCRQSYVINLTYDIDHEKQMGKKNTDEEGPELDCDKLSGTLRWNDIPEPGVNKVTHSRLFISIEKETRLCEIMKTSNYRPLQVPSRDKNYPSTIQARLPPFEKLSLFDAEDKWILRANAVVLDGKDQAQMNEGIKFLAEVKSDFEGFVKFDVKDRFLHDTRVKT